MRPSDHRSVNQDAHDRNEVVDLDSFASESKTSIRIINSEGGSA